MNQPSTHSTWNSLDGARALSIGCVLACHLLPLGPKTVFDLNIAAGQFGMAIFFSLSGFLIAHKLITERSLFEFAVSRILRIFPLLWLLLLINFAVRLPEINIDTMAVHFLLVVNNFPDHYFRETEHLWSLCTEVHFYALAALCVLIFKRAGLPLLVITGCILSMYRFNEQALFNTSTLFRLDELLIGLSLGLIWHSDSPASRHCKKLLTTINPFYAMVCLAVASLAPPNPVLFILRPYIAALFIGSLIFNTQATTSQIMTSPTLKWISRHAYALYIIHPFLLLTWLGSGDKITMYLKRPLLFIALFVLAYLSTRYYEQFFIRQGKQWIRQRRNTKTTLPSPPAVTN
ncbi:MAG: acyltransferase [Limnobacter sp.]|uniref:acyltransferase family protein n=1 Tax=Limnobacter sp. TaxID=2003368 RepID=UPI0032EDED3F